MNDSEAAKARRFALRLIRYRDRSESELIGRLRQKGFSDTVIHGTMEALKESGLVNDLTLARSLTDIAMNVRLLGNKGIVFFLRSRGISDKDLPIENPNGPDELERALILYRKKSKFLSFLPEIDKKKKLRSFLLRRGYTSETVNEVIKTLFSS